MLLEHDEMDWRADRRGRRMYDEKHVFPPNIADHQREKAMRALSLSQQPHLDAPTRGFPSYLPKPLHIPP